MYESFQIKWLDKPEIRKYKTQDQVKLSYRDLNDLLFFDLFVFNELHTRLVKIVEEHGFKVKPFEQYMATFGSFDFVAVENSCNKPL